MFQETVKGQLNDKVKAGNGISEISRASDMTYYMSKSCNHLPKNGLWASTDFVFDN